MGLSEKVRYLVFDIESVADGDLIAQTRYAGERLSPEEAIARYREELMETRGSDFIPYTYQIPVSVVAAKVDAEHRLMDIAALDEPHYRPPEITHKFWRGWERYRQPTWVSFNGRGFDMPLMELAAFRYGVSLPSWFNIHARSWEQNRARYNVDSHLDLHDLLTNFGASRFNGGLNLAANLIGKPGKMQVQGYMVQDLYNEGRIADINDYCRCDVLDTYFVFLRAAVVLGDLTLEQEQERVEHVKQWLIEHRQERPVYNLYLDNWGDWENPWEESQAELFSSQP